MSCLGSFEMNVKGQTKSSSNVQPNWVHVVTGGVTPVHSLQVSLGSRLGCKGSCFLQHQVGQVNSE